MSLKKTCLCFLNNFSCCRNFPDAVPTTLHKFGARLFKVIYCRSSAVYVTNGRRDELTAAYLFTIKKCQLASGTALTKYKCKPGLYFVLLYR